MSRCLNCPHPERPVVSGEWKRKGRPTLAIIGQNPGRMEVYFERPFVGPSGRLLKEAVGDAWDGGIYTSNALSCAPTETEASKDFKDEVTACLGRLVEELRKVRPDVILVLGVPAKRAAAQFPEDLKAIPTAFYTHPASVLRKGGAGQRVGSWVQGCRASLVKLLTEPHVPLIVNSESPPEEFPGLVGVDTEYPSKPVWLGPTVLAVSDGRNAWVTTAPQQGVVGFLRARTCVFHHGVNELMGLMALDHQVPEDAHCSMVLACLDDEEGPRDLKTLAATKLGLVYDVPRPKEVSEDLRSRVYCAADAQAALGLYHVYSEARERSLYQGLYRPLLAPLARMGFDGLLVDVKAAEEMRTEALVRIEELWGGLTGYADINWGSDTQVEAYFVRCGYPLGKQTPKGLRHSVDKEVLKDLLDCGIKEAELLTQLRVVQKKESTYLRAIVESGGVVHTVFNPVGAESGRISSGGDQRKLGFGMNFQNIPEDLRVLFHLPDPDLVWLEADVSQMEVRVMGFLAERHLTTRPLMTALLMSEDLYAEVARDLLGRDPSEEEREVFKMVVLAGQYGAQPQTLVTQAGVQGVKTTVEQVKKFLAYVDQRFPTMRWWREAQYNEARRQGYITTPFGRRRHIRVDPGGELRPDTRRIIVNSPVQGTASDLTLRGMKRALDQGLAAGMKAAVGGVASIVLTVHDSIDAMVPRKDVVEVGRLLKRAIEDDPIFEGQPFLKVKVKAGPNWGNLEVVRV